MTPVLNSLWLFEEDELDLSELLEYLRALITDDRKIIHGNSELKRLIRCMISLSTRRPSTYRLLVSSPT